MRERYAEHLQTILPAGLMGLLITLDYDQSQIAGPPFSVDDVQVQHLFGTAWQMQLLESQDVLSDSGKFVQAGATRLEERVYRITAR